MIRITEYEKQWHMDFRRLNLEWLEANGLTESHDLEILDDPEGTVIAGGGCIFIALANDRVVGTAGLWKENESEYELVKMTVDPEYQGRGISKLLLDRCLQEAKDRGAKKVFLFSSSKLKIALNLYEQYGFHYMPLVNSPFETADVKMELSLTPDQI